MKNFNLPDLGEGLAEAEIVRWHVKAGDHVNADTPMLAVETAKAIVEVPSPHSGVIKAIYGGPGDTVATGALLVEFEPDAPAATPRADANLATRTAGGPTAPNAPRSTGASLTRASPSSHAIGATTTLAAHYDAGTVSQRNTNGGQPSAQRPDNTHQGEHLKGLRHAMAQTMATSRDNVMGCTLFDDADVHAWQPEQDITSRILRAIAEGCSAEPGLNAWFDGVTLTRRVLSDIDVAIMVDTPEGLMTPVIRNIRGRPVAELRRDVDRLKQGTRERRVSPEALRDFTFLLSNFGMIAGRYATPVVVPPAVAILGCGRLGQDVVISTQTGSIEAHLRMPLSLTFDHRCVTGGEAARFLAAVIRDLHKGN